MYVSTYENVYSFYTQLYWKIKVFKARFQYGKTTQADKIFKPATESLRATKFLSGSVGTS